MRSVRSSLGISLLAVGALLAAGLLAASAGMVAGLDNAILDGLFRFNRQHHERGVRAEPVIVGIDEAFLESIDEPLTLSHFHIARFLEV